MANISDIPASSSTIATTRSKCQKTLHDTVCTEQCELPTGKLPVQKDVVCCMLYLLQYGVKMASLEYDFLEDQKGPWISYCMSLVDRKWEKTTQRRQKDQLSYERMKKNEERSHPKAIP